MADEDSMTLDAAASTDLIEGPAEHPVYDPGVIESTPAKTDLTLNQALALPDGDDHAVATAQATTPIIYRDGKGLTLNDLVNGYEHSIHLQANADYLNSLHALVGIAARNLVTGAAALAQFIASKLPPMPHVALATINPTEYLQQKVTHDEGHAIVAQIVHAANQAAAQAAQFEAQRHNERVKVECRRLVECFPETATPEGQEKFFDAIRDVVYAAGFTEDELRAVSDHRMYRVAYMAIAGLEKERQKAGQKQQRKAAPQRKTAVEPPPKHESISLDDAVSLDVD